MEGKLGKANMLGIIYSSNVRRWRHVPSFPRNVLKSSCSWRAGRGLDAALLAGLSYYRLKKLFLILSGVRCKVGVEGPITVRVER